LDFCNNNIISGNTILNNSNYGISITHVDNSQITNNTIEDNYSGILISSHSDNNLISENEIADNYLNGIDFIALGNNNSISGNSITNNQQNGLSISTEFYGRNNVFSGNLIEANHSDGIYCHNYCNHSIISGNTINANWGNGISLTEWSKYNIISGNIINNNFIGTGIYVSNECNNNYFTYNNLISNAINVYDESINIWDNGYPSGGNYFDDYTGVDNFSGPNQNIPGSDGIGDTPYIIPGGSNQDQYPFIEEWPVNYPYPSPDTIYIDDDFNASTTGWGVDHFSGIHWGINAVAVKGIVRVANGIYYEHLAINKQIHLIGEDLDSTIIDGNGERNVIYTSADSVNISGFKIQNSGSSNDNAGIYIGGWYTGSGLVTDNNLINNNGYGLFVHWSSDNNKIYHNNLINNTLGNAYNEDMGYAHYWDNGYGTPFNPLTDGGNFWDDYTGEDNFSGPDQNIPGPDGIGDTPYLINPGGYAQGQDNYPLMVPWNPSLPNVPLIVYVDDDYNDTTLGWGYTRFNLIQDGIDAVDTGGTVIIKPGFYYENIDINKKIYLIGEDRDSTLLDGNGIGDVVSILADSVLCKGLTIQNCGYSSQNSGIQILSNHNHISENSIRNNYGFGIKISTEFTGNVFFHNNFFNNGINAYDEGDNFWDNGYPSGGNYWDNYLGTDNFRGPSQSILGPDGIGDTIYSINGGENKDNYPFIQPGWTSALPSIIVYVDDYFNEYTTGWGYDHFNTIQSGISNVAVCGNVIVSMGIYYENIVINKELNLLGEDNIYTIIDGGGIGDVVKILSDSVTISGFKIQNSGPEIGDAGIHLWSKCYNIIKGNIITNNDFSIGFEGGCNHNIISCNTITNNDYYSLYIYSSNYNIITGNSISSNNDIGIYLKAYSSYNYITYNIIINNSADGIGLYSSCSNNSIVRNKIHYNSQNGIRLRSNCNNNYISENDVVENNIYGINAYSLSNNNTILHNNLFNNISGNAKDVCSNTWHNSYSTPFNPSTDGGNYWSDYTGPDKFHGPNQDTLGNDGIGDTSYNIAGGSNVDQYPFMEPDGWNISVNLNVFLEGAYNPNEVIPILNSSGLIPLFHPYSGHPWYYNGYEGVTDIPNSDIVDWILVELRDTTLAELATAETIAAQQTAFLLNNGSVVDFDGFSKLQFNYYVKYNLFVVVRHRNHLAIMSANPLVESDGVYSYNFTSSAEQAYLSNQKELSPGVWGMISGDADASGLIDETDKSVLWEMQAGSKGYFQGDLNLNTQINNQDKNDFWLPNLVAGSQVPD